MKVKFRFEDETCISSSLNDVAIDIDVGKISQVIRNLVSNAIKFTPVHGVVTVSAHFIEKSDVSIEEPALAFIAAERKSIKKSLSRSSSAVAYLIGADPTFDGDDDDDIESGILRIEVKDSGCGMSIVYLIISYFKDSYCIYRNNNKP